MSDDNTPQVKHKKTLAPAHKNPNHAAPRTHQAGGANHRTHTKPQHAHKQVASKPAAPRAKNYSDDDANTIMLTIKMPIDLIEDLKTMSELRGAIGYRTIMRNYTIEGLARDAQKYGLISDDKLLDALKRRGAPQEAVDYISQVLKIITPPKLEPITAAQDGPADSKPAKATKASKVPPADADTTASTAVEPAAADTPADAAAPAAATDTPDASPATAT